MYFTALSRSRSSLKQLTLCRASDRSQRSYIFCRGLDSRNCNTHWPTFLASKYNNSISSLIVSKLICVRSISSRLQAVILLYSFYWKPRKTKSNQYIVFPLIPFDILVDSLGWRPDASYALWPCRTSVRHCQRLKRFIAVSRRTLSIGQSIL